MGHGRIGEKRCDKRRVWPGTEGVSAVRSRDIAGVGYTHNILMGIHIYSEAIFFAFPQHANGVLHKVVVIDPTGGPSVGGSGIEQ
jgi:hypothetical protein